MAKPSRGSISFADVITYNPNPLFQFMYVSSLQLNCPTFFTLILLFTRGTWGVKKVITIDMSSKVVSALADTYSLWWILKYCNIGFARARWPSYHLPALFLGVKISIKGLGYNR
jgi:hypothetical protein